MMKLTMFLRLVILVIRILIKITEIVFAIIQAVVTITLVIITITTITIAEGMIANNDDKYNNSIQSSIFFSFNFT